MRSQKGNLAQPGRQRCRQSVFTDGPAQNTDGGDADLDGRQKTGGFVGQCQRRLSAGAAIIGQFLQTRFSGGDNGDLGHRENAIEQNQQQ